MKAANAFNNQFQLPDPVLILLGLALATRKADLLFVVMSWIFVVLRLAHAVVHAGPNDVKLRFWLYLVGALDLMAMWALFAFRISWDLEPGSGEPFGQARNVHDSVLTA